MRSATRLRRLDRFDQSRFWRQLDGAGREAGSAALDQLRATVRTVAGQAASISGQICRYLPHYTLHDERHILNVLAIMDALVPDELIERLTPLECGLCILAAYVHDLGMALPHEEWLRISGDTDTPERRRFLRHREGFTAEIEQIERWRRIGGAEARRRIELIESFILAEFIRTTHTDERQVGRIEGWLAAMEEAADNPSLFRYGREDYRHLLALVAASHGEDAAWLRQRLTGLAGEEGGFCRLVELGEWVNYAFPGMLLRLADIMDFDASRAPRILFQHVGIDNDTSILEWQKHMSIVGWDVRAERDAQRLHYQAESPHPVIEKAIRDFAGKIEQELRAVGVEIEIQRRWLAEDGQRLELFLPGRVDVGVRPQRGPEGPAYVYADLQFELDQTEIQRLLMGEALYADPSIAIRELLQNALDALQMRDLRLRLQAAGVAEGGPADPVPAGEELRSELEWGRDEVSGQEVIRVRDNGIGMSQEVVADYFTQVGRSFYRSPEFVREQALMRTHGLRMSPISRFGIGFLACFMIADRLLVRTHPGRGAAGLRPHDITILGPDSLFWLRPGTLAGQGTEVTLFLKPGIRLAAEPGSAAAGRTAAELPPERAVRPGEIARASVVWPRYPVLLQPPDGGLDRIDGSSWREELSRLAPSPLRWIERAADWGASDRQLGSTEWGFWEWADQAGPEATGSRIRLVFPRHREGGADRESDLPRDPPAESPLCRQDELAAFVEADLARHLAEERRTRVLVRGIEVPDPGVCLPEVPVGHAVGALVLIDLDGPAAPQLTADRRSMVVPEDAAGWRDALAGFFTRLRDELERQLAGEPATARNLLSAFRWPQAWRLSGSGGGDHREATLDLLQGAGMAWAAAPRQRLLWAFGRWLQDLAGQSDGRLPRDPDLARRLGDGAALQRPRAAGRWRSFAADRERARRLDPDLGREVQLPLEWSAARRLAPGLARELAQALARRPDEDLAGTPLENCRVGSWLQQALEPDLGRSLPLFGAFGLEGRLADGELTAPGRVRFELERDGRTVHPSATGTGSGSPAAIGYHLVFPLTAVPLGELRRRCPDWRSDRRLAALGVAPFLYPELHDLWPRHAVALFGLFQVREIYALLPRIELWSQPFDRWSDADRRHGCLSALWNLETGAVLWAEGMQPVDATRSRGTPFGLFAAPGGRRPAAAAEVT